MTGALAAAYQSGSQRSRVVTESWGESNLYCPNCSSPILARLRNNTKASDYSCPACGLWYQLKGQQSRIGNTITDGAYGAMMNAIRHDETPNFYFMQYELSTWRVKNLLLVPSFAFPPSAIIKRKPLSSTARRAGWVGCNIALNRVPAEARIDLVRTIASQGRTCSPSEPRRDRDIAPYQQTIIVPPSEVREKFKRVKPLKDISVTQRGWSLDVLNAIRRLGKSEFTTADAYAFTRDWKNSIPTTATSATKSASNSKCCVI